MLISIRSYTNGHDRQRSAARVDTLVQLILHLQDCVL